MKNNLDDAFNITPTEVEVDPVEVKEPVGIQKPDRLTKDDGKGISKENITDKRKTFGVFGMQERASSLGGVLKINKNNKKGTTVNLILPYKNKNTHSYD